jgi:hypothetical protein
MANGSCSKSRGGNLKPSSCKPMARLAAFAIAPQLILLGLRRED